VSATYDPSLSTTRDWLRFRVQDTVVNPASAALFSDEELDALLAENGDSVWNAAVDAARALAARFRHLASLSVGDTSISFTDQAAAYDAMAAQFQTKVGGTPFTGGISRADVLGRQDNADRVAPFFERTTRDPAEGYRS
jgi:hypothetical protein